MKHQPAHLLARSALLAGLVLVVAAPTWVTAQTDLTATESSPVTSAESTDPVVFEKPSVQAQIETTKDQYRAEFGAYRTAERAFQVAKQQSKQLGTLASLEVAVQASREVFKRRDEVLLTYFEILRLELIEAEGIEVNLKDTTLTDISKAVEALRVHLTHVEAIADRGDVAAQVAAFAQLSPQLEELTYRTLSMLNIGKLRLVYDKSRQLATQLQAESAVADNPLQQAERDRGFAENNRALDTAELDFETVDSDFNRVTGKHSQSTYNQINRKLGSVYAGLSTVLSYITELAKTAQAE